MSLGFLANALGRHRRKPLKTGPRFPARISCPEHGRISRLNGQVLHGRNGYDLCLFRALELPGHVVDDIDEAKLIPARSRKKSSLKASSLKQNR